jgi:hypothetical protein
MKCLTCFLLVLLTVAPLCAKPKVEVRVKVNDTAIAQHAERAILNGEGREPDPRFFVTYWLLNVTLMSDNSKAVAKNNGQWCITGSTGLDWTVEYQGTLNGNWLDIQIPDKDGKTKTLHFEVVDHKWRKL